MSFESIEDIGCKAYEQWQRRIHRDYLVGLYFYTTLFQLRNLRNEYRWNCYFR